MRAWGAWSIAAAALGVSGCGFDAYTCSSNAQCTQSADGICEANGACSYADPECDSGRRYSDYGPALRGQCVPVDPGDGSTSTGSTTAASTAMPADADSSSSSSSGDASSSSTGGPSDACGGCSGHGKCVEVEGEPTCACEAGWTMVGLECLEDPCETVQCYYVDAEAEEGGDGSLETPWQTRAQAFAYLPSASPGDHILFRRGFSYPGDDAFLTVSGTEESPIVIGAYGPPDVSRPNLSNARLRIEGSEHLVVRDLGLVGTGASDCLVVVSSGWITIRDNEIWECGDRGVNIIDQSHHTTLFRNRIRDAGAQSSVVVSDNPSEMPPVLLGQHHWVAGNTIENADQFGVWVRFGPEEHPAGTMGDIKVVGNEILSAARGGVGIMAPAGWVNGNTIIDSVSTSEPNNGGLVPNQSPRSWLHVRGNVISGPNGGLVVRWEGVAERNSVFQLGGGNAVVRVATNYEGMSFRDNLVLADSVPHTSGAAAVAMAGGEFENNRYASLLEAGCTFATGNPKNPTTDIEGWQSMSDSDADSVCEVVPGISIPPATSTPISAAYWSAVTPDASWDGCGAVGALDCDGEPIPMRFMPIEGVEDNAGLGWEGPLIIQQHYPLLEG